MKRIMPIGVPRPAMATSMRTSGGRPLNSEMRFFMVYLSAVIRR
jgi:hypothetical protein